MANWQPDLRRTFPKPPPIATGPGGVPVGSPTMPEAAGQGNFIPTLGPHIIPGSTAAPTQGGAPDMTLDALMARQKELASQQSEMPPMVAPTQGLAYALQQGLQGFERGRTDRDATRSRDELAQIMSEVDPATGPTQEQMGRLMQISPEIGMQMYGQQSGQAKQEHWTPIPTPAGESGQWFQNQNGDVKKVGGGEGTSGPKESDVASLADDFTNVPDVKAYQGAQPMWRSMQDAAQTDTAQADLNMVIAMAKLFDPTSVVRTEEGKAVELTGDYPSSLGGYFKYLTGTPGSRLSRETRQGMMHEGFSRMNGYYKGVGEASKWFTEKATHRGYDPRDIVRPFEAPTPFDPDKVVGSDSESAPATGTGTGGRPAPPKPPDQPPAPDTGGGGGPAPVPDPKKTIRAKAPQPDGSVIIYYSDGSTERIPAPKGVG